MPRTHVSSSLKPTDKLTVQTVDSGFKLKGEKKHVVRLGIAFDLDMRYGPFVGIDRLTRWKRAIKFGLISKQIANTITEEQLEAKEKNESKRRKLW